eukprot:Gb_20387 [translate_table: standard]
MSWLVRSLGAPFQAHEPTDGADEKQVEKQAEKQDEEACDSGGGVKEDLSELKKTFTRQLWGVASFIAPPPATKYDPRAKTSPPLTNTDDQAEHNLHPSNQLDGKNQPEGIRTSDLSELTGLVKTGFSRLSSVIHRGREDEFNATGSETEEVKNLGKRVNFGINEISRLASSFLPFNRDFELEDSVSFHEEEPRAVGLTEEVLTFATNISKHPETWLDFPLFSDEDDIDDFDMSDVQQEHALAVERVAPRLAALRIELCPGYMSEGQFWKIYFVLLHPRLSKQDALLLSTPQIVEARGLILQELQKRNKTEASNIGSVLDGPEGKSHLMRQEQKFYHLSPLADNNERPESFKIVSIEAATPVATKDLKSDYHLSSQRETFSPGPTSEKPFIENKDVLTTTVKLSDVKHINEDSEVDDWLQEEDSGTDMPVDTASGLGNEEDVSFSDLEDEDDSEVQASSQSLKCNTNSTSKLSK